jgi:hypothetical protein
MKEMSFLLCNAVPLLQKHDTDQQPSQPTQYLPDTIANEFEEVA